MKLIYSLKKYKHWFVDNIQGTTSIEYAIVAAAMAVIITSVVINDGFEEKAMKHIFNTLGTKLVNFIS